MRDGSTALETATSPRCAGAEVRQSFASVTTCQDLLAPPELVWEGLLFYEEITERPPFIVRSFLPRPIGTAGCKFEVGGEVKCRYVGGHLLKRITQITRPWTYAFEVIEQNLPLGGIKLLGGDYALFKLSEDQTRVAVTTRYASPNQPRWLCRRIEAGLCHALHGYILNSMRSNLSRHRIE